MDDADDLVRYQLGELKEEVRGPHGVVARLERRMDGVERKLTWILGLMVTGLITAVVAIVAHL